MERGSGAGRSRGDWGRMRGRTGGGRRGWRLLMMGTLDFLASSCSMAVERWWGLGTSSRALSGRGVTD